MSKNLSNPEAAYIRIIRPSEEVKNRFICLVTKLLKDKPLDTYKERTATIIGPAAIEKEWNGGVWAEGFEGKIQVPHTHANDSKNAKERFLLIYPQGGDGQVEIVHKGKVERYYFPQDTLSLLHFDWSEPHKFSALGKRAKLLCFAIHTRDVATDLNALETQTKRFKKSFREFSSTEFHPPADIPREKDPMGKALSAAEQLLTTPLVLEPELKSHLAAQALSIIAECLSIQGAEYGSAKHHGDSKSLGNWRRAILARGFSGEKQI